MLSNWIHKRIIKSIILWDWLVMALTKHQLQLTTLTLKESFIRSGSNYTVCWRVKGCYKIEVNESTILTGRSAQLVLKHQAKSTHLTITFFGIQNTIKKSMPLQILALTNKTSFTYKDKISKPVKFLLPTIDSNFLPHRLHSFAPLPPLKKRNRLTFRLPITQTLLLPPYTTISNVANTSILQGYKKAMLPPSNAQSQNSLATHLDN